MKKLALGLSAPTSSGLQKVMGELVTEVAFHKITNFFAAPPCLKSANSSGLFSYSQRLLRFAWQMNKDKIGLWVEIVFA